MRKNDLEGLKERVLCAIVLAKSDFAVDVKESTRRAVKYRRGAEIIIVIHAGRGWFDPLSDAKGDVFSLVEHIDRVEFLEAVVAWRLIARMRSFCIFLLLNVRIGHQRGSHIKCN